MDIGQKLLDLRKQKKLSQEEAAEKLNVSRQTISKWETNQSTPDFDKLSSICKLYDITADELINGISTEKHIDNNDNINKKARGIGISILIYFLSIIWIMISIPVLKMNPIVASAIFLLICAVATFYIVYTSITYKNAKIIKEKKEISPIFKTIKQICALITSIMYFTISLITMAWHLTWIIWIIYALVIEIIKLIFMLKGESYEK